MSDPEQGLSGAEAARRLAEYGPNEPAPVRRLSAVVQLLHLFANPLVIILLVASAIAGTLGQAVDAVIIVTMVVLGVAINFWQSYRSQQAADQLRASVSPTATVLRDGAWQETPLRNVVPGDVVPALGRRSDPGRRATRRVARSLRSAIDADGRVAASRQSGRHHARAGRRAPTRPIWCSSAPRSSAARARRWRSPPVRRRCSATSRSGYGRARRKPNSNTGCADSAC